MSSEPGLAEYEEAMSLLDSIRLLSHDDLCDNLHRVTTKLWLAGELGHLKAFERIAHISTCVGRSTSAVAFPAMLRAFNGGLREDMKYVLACCFGEGVCVEKNAEVERFFQGRGPLTEGVSKVLDSYGFKGYEELAVAL